MHTKIEGILISKMPYKERHLLGNLLLRDGKKLGVIFLGGLGGGAKKKSTELELGYMLKVELKEAKKRSDLYYAKEWQPLWFHRNIRLNYQAFSLLCFFLELIGKMVVEADVFEEDEEDPFFEGIFRVLSNGLVLLEKSLPKNFKGHEQMLVFLAKLLIEQGVFPEREVCALSGEKIIFNRESISLVPEQGGFVLNQYLNNNMQDYEGDDNFELWKLLGVIAENQYKDLKNIELERREIPRQLFNYLCFQFHLSQKSFKTVSMVL